MTSLQAAIEKARAVYQAQGQPPLLQQIAQVHGVSVREFAVIFDIPKSSAAEILSHKKFPSLELALRIARYFECTVEDIFGWRIDDTGERRPLLVVDPQTNQARRLVGKDKVGAIELAMEGRHHGRNKTIESAD